MSAMHPNELKINQALAVAFGNVLRTAREAAGLTQEMLAIRAKLDRTYPSLLERGLRSPTLSTLIALAPVLGVAPETLVKRLEAQVPQALFAEGRGKRVQRAKHRKKKRRLRS
jgi:transcriptional regulator with XRE-family HTH domain